MEVKNDDCQGNLTYGFQPGWIYCHNNGMVELWYEIRKD
jgi:hypothetical protein